MKILHVSPNFPLPSNDGGKIVIYNFYKYMCKLGAEVDFIALSKEKVDENFIKEFQNKITVHYDKEVISYKRLVRALLKNKSYLMNKFYSNRFSSILNDFVAEGNYDIIQFEGLHLAEYALHLINRTNAKIVLRLHNLESIILKRFCEQTNNLLKKMFFKYEYKKIKKLENLSYKRIKNIVFISKEDYNHSGINQIAGANPFVSPAGVDIEYFSKINEKENINLFYIGSMDWKPNEEAVYWFLNKVFKIVQKSYPNIHFYIIGKNPSKGLKKINSNSITVTGTVPDVRPYIENADICVVPIFIGGGMRVKILEMMAAGKTIISTSIGAEGINYNDGENILIANSDSEFIDKIKSLIEGRESKKRIAVNAKDFVSNNYSWNKIINEYKIYLETL